MRKPRLEYQGALFHVIARGNQRQKVFQDDGDRVRYLKLLGEGLEERVFALYAYCLMGNHVHLLIERNGEYALSRYMQRLQSAYTTFYNHKHRKCGHLFQGRYKAILVDRESYLLELVRYIHLNPLRAGMEKADAYPWNSHRQYMGKDRYPLAPVKTDLVLSMFSKIKPLARRKYLDYLKEGDQEGERGKLYDLRCGRILGDADFERETYEKAGANQEASLKLGMDIGRIWAAILGREGLKKAPSVWRRSRLMGETAYLAMEGAGIRQKAVAEYFNVDPTTVNKAVKRLEGRWEKRIGSREELLRWARGL